MTTSNCSALGISIVLLCSGSAAGWAIADDLAGSEAAASFLMFSGLTVSFIFLVQILLFFSAREKLFFTLLFLAGFGISLVWFMLCLFLPIFWMEGVGMFTKATILVVVILLFSANSIKGARDFEEGWRKKLPVVEKYYKSTERILDWEKLIKSLRLSASIFIPGAPKWVEPLLSVLLILSMILGLNIRKVNPTFSVLAWGVPCVIASSTLLQIVAMRFAQALKVAQIEKHLGVSIRPKIS